MSSSASIYRSDRGSIVDESSPISPASPYARTKLVVEHMLRDVSAATTLRVIALRYFNPIGSDPLMRTGPHVRAPMQVLTGLILASVEQRPFRVTGFDFPTRDGSGIRDYVHVWDLALAHIAALEKFDTVLEHDTYRAFNLGSGHGTTVLELVHEFERVAGSAIEVVRSPRRAGDVAGSFASNSRAERELGWVPVRSLVDGIADALEWVGRQTEGGSASRPEQCAHLMH